MGSSSTRVFVLVGLMLAIVLLTSSSSEVVAARDLAAQTMSTPNSEFRSECKSNTCSQCCLSYGSECKSNTCSQCCLSYGLSKEEKTLKTNGVVERNPPAYSGNDPWTTTWP